MCPFIFKIPVKLPYSELTILLGGSAGDELGYSVAIDGTTMVLGARQAGVAGEAYVYEKSGNSWLQVQQLVPSDGAADDFFGFSVSISGNVIVVGASRKNTNGFVDSGGAYIFEKSGTWPATETQFIRAQVIGADDQFGQAVDVSGSVVVVSASRTDPGGVSNVGTLYVFEKSGTWPATETQTMVASDGASGDQLGFSVSISGSVVVSGAFSADVNGVSNAGAAYVFEKGATWPATETAKLIASDGLINDQFGFSADVSGSIIVVAARAADPGGVSSAGAAYVFEKTTTWPATETKKMIASDGASGDQLGQSIAISANVIIASSHLSDVNGVDSGAAYIFEKIGVWPATETQKLLASDGASGDRFGFSVRVDGDVIVVGAFSADTTNGVDSGAAYVFSR